MNEELLISIAFPGDTYSKVLEDYKLLMNKDLDDENMYERHTIGFFLYVINQIMPLDKDVKVKLIESFFYPNINFISSQCFAEFFFNRISVDAVLTFLNKYDQEYFWDAFGISLDKGEVFYKKMCSLDENPNVLSEIHNEIIKSSKLKKDILVNDLSPYILLRTDCSEEEFEEAANFLLGIHELAHKYPSIIEALEMVYENENRMLNIVNIFDNLRLVKEYQDGLEECPSSQALFYIIKMSFVTGNIIACLEIIHAILTKENKTIQTLVLNSFRMYRYGYQAYLYYIFWCKRKNIEPGFEIEVNSECYFYNSYKVPQIKSLYKRYFSELSEEEAKKKTKECFEEIYDSLIEEDFLDEGCRREEFLWAFGLTDEYPFAFKKIKFYTLSGRSKRDKGNGAFLCLLTILGYTSEEIKAMLHRNPEKSYINKTFDLSLKDNTKMSKDYKVLLEIVKSSGLPIQR